MALPDGTLEPESVATVVVGDLPKSGDHPAKAVQMLPAGTLLVSIGSETNSCQPENRVAYLEDVAEIRGRIA